MRHSILGSLRFALAAAVALTTANCAVQTALPECDADNGSIQLPDGFCGVVVADGLGAARHLDVAANGDIFVAIRNRENAPGGIVALRDTDGDGRADVQERFGEDGGTSIQLHNGYLYFGRATAIVRYRMTPGALVPEGPGEVIAALPDQQGHRAKGFAFDGRGECMSTSARPPTTATLAGAFQKSPDRIRARSLKGMVASGGSTRTPRVRPRIPARDSRPACGRTSPWPGIRPRADSTSSSMDAIGSTRCGPASSRWSRTRSCPQRSS